jgi:hypothetical protein
VCQRCCEIDVKLARYRYVKRWTTDPAALKAIVELTAEYEAEKHALCLSVQTQHLSSK